MLILNVVQYSPDTVIGTEQSMLGLAKVDERTA